MVPSGCFYCPQTLISTLFITHILLQHLWQSCVRKSKIRKGHIKWSIKAKKKKKFLYVCPLCSEFLLFEVDHQYYNPFPTLAPIFFYFFICHWNLPFWGRNSAIIFTKKANNWLDKGLAVIGGHLITVADSNNGARPSSLLQLPVKCAITLSNRDTLIVTIISLLGHFPLFTVTLWRDGLHPAQTSTPATPQTNLKGQCVKI